MAGEGKGGIYTLLGGRLGRSSSGYLELYRDSPGGGGGEASRLLRVTLTCFWIGFLDPLALQSESHLDFSWFHPDRYFVKCTVFVYIVNFTLYTGQCNVYSQDL